MFEKNKKYSTQELAKEMQISFSTFRNNKEKYLDYLSIFCDFEISYSGRSTYYTITEIYGEYEKLTKKSAEKKEKAYREASIEVIKKDNLQTAANIGRLIKNDNKIKELHHADSTICRYAQKAIRKMLDENILHIEDKLWCRLSKEENKYYKLSNEEIKEFFELFGAYQKEENKIQLEVISDFKNGLIKKDDLAAKVSDNLLNIFDAARLEFMERHGYFPIKVPVYVFNALRAEGLA